MKVIAEDGKVLYRCSGCDMIHQIRTKSWSWNGDSEKPTFSPSILTNCIHRCHHYVRDGKIEYLGDCTHALAGKTVEMEDI